MRPGLGHHHIISLRTPSPTFLEPPVVIRISRPRFPGSELGVIQGSVQSVGDSISGSGTWGVVLSHSGCGRQESIVGVWGLRLSVKIWHRDIHASISATFSPQVA